jgi:hypothetical protein
MGHRDVSREKQEGARMHERNGGCFNNYQERDRLFMFGQVLLHAPLGVLFAGEVLIHCPDLMPHHILA